jgi:hypothetical protein
VTTKKPEAEPQTAVVDSEAEDRGEESTTGAEPEKPLPETVDPKEALNRSLIQLASRIRSNHTGWLALYGYSYAEKQFQRIRDDCTELRKQILTLSEDEGALLEFQGRMDDVEASYNRLRFRLVVIPSSIVIGLAAVVIGFLVMHTGLLDYIQDKLEIRRLMRYVLMAVAGAVLWSLTSIMSKQHVGTSPDSRHVPLGHILIRVLIAIVVPTILVILTFKKDGAPMKLVDIWKAPEAWSFLCGYSVQVVITALNKLVDKVTKMIESV